MLKGPFKVSFDLQGGTGETPMFYVFEGEIPFPKIDDPIKNHYIFKGYGLEKETEDYIQKYFQVAADTTIYAQWEREDFLVTYDADGGIGEMDPTFVTVDKDTETGVYTFVENKFEKTHYKYIGWKTSATGDTVYKAGDKITIDDDITVTAVWEMVDILCKFDANGAPGEMASIWVQSTFVAPENGFEKYLKHEFRSWQLTIGGVSKGSYKSGASITVPTGTTEITLVANWDEFLALKAAKDLSECQPGSVIYIFAAYSTTGNNVRPLRATTDGSYKAYSGSPYFNGNRQTPYKLKITSLEYAQKYSTIQLPNGKLQIVNIDSDTPNSKTGLGSTASTPNDLLTREGGARVGEGLGSSLIMYHLANFAYVCVADLAYSSGAGSSLSARYYNGQRQFFVFVEDEEAY